MNNLVEGKMDIMNQTKRGAGQNDELLQLTQVELQNEVRFLKDALQQQREKQEVNFDDQQKLFYTL
jgi:hypothetical protein